MQSDKQDGKNRIDWKRFAAGSEIRGTAQALTDEFATVFGYVFAEWTAERIGTTADRLTIAVGRDPRKSGERLLNALIRGLTNASCEVLDCDVTTTPALGMMMSTDAHIHAAIMVTGSYHAAGKNGFKLLLKDGFVTDADVRALLERAIQMEVPNRVSEIEDVNERYMARLAAVARDRLEDEALCPLLGLHVVVDAAGGAGGFYAKLLEDLGAETTGSMNLEPDPLLSAHTPDPEDPSSLRALAKAVVENEADLGVAFDPDCTCAAFVDGEGHLIHRDRLIALVTAIVLEDIPGATFVTDSVTSTGLTRFIQEWGGVHYRYKRGYRNVIQEAIRLNEEDIDCPLAIESSGHCAFRENDFRDDGMYLATWLICEAMDRKREGQTLSTLLDDLREPVETAEIRLPVVSGEVHAAAVEVIDTVMAHTLEDTRWRNAPDNREGVRIKFNLGDGVENAWFQLRVSVHDPVLVLDAQSEVEGGLKQILGELSDLFEDGFDNVDVEPLRKWLDKKE